MTWDLPRSPGPRTGSGLVMKRLVFDIRLAIKFQSVMPKMHGKGASLSSARVDTCDTDFTLGWWGKVDHQGKVNHPPSCFYE